MTDQTPDETGSPDVPAVPPPGGPQAMDITPAAPVAAPRRRGRAVVVAIGAALAVLVGGGTVWAVSALSGGGTQPEALVPASALGFVDVDLDPAAGEKIDAARFLRKFPSLSDDVTEDGDLFEQLVRAGLEADSSGTFDYDRDIEPWAGRRAGVAVLPPAEGAGADELDGLVVIQVTDEAKARTSLRRILDEGTEPGDAAGLVVRDGYALIGSDQEATEAASRAAAQSSLADDQQYRDDMDVLGDRGVATAWLDLPGMIRAGSDQVAGSGTGVEASAVDKLAENAGRVAAALRFDPDFAEVSARVVGVDAEVLGTGADPSGALVAGLPQGTVAALGVGDLGAVVDRAWEQVTDTVGVVGAAELANEAQRTLGVRLPDDLGVLLGQSLVVGLDVDARAEDFQVGVRERNSEAAAAKTLIDRLLAKARAEVGAEELAEVTSTLTDDGLVVASSPQWAERLVSPGPVLGDDAVFAKAVPDAQSAGSVLWLDLREVVGAIRETGMVEDAAELDVLGGLGVSSRVDGSTLAVDLRLVLR